MNGSKFSSSLLFLILGCFSRHISTIPKKQIYKKLSVIWDILSLPKEVVNFSQNPQLIAVLPGQVCQFELSAVPWQSQGSYMIPSLELACAQQAWSIERAHSCQPTPFHVDFLWVFSGQLQDFSSLKYNEYAGNMKHFTSPWPFVLWASVPPFIFLNYWKTGTEMVCDGPLVVFCMPLVSPSFPCL